MENSTVTLNQVQDIYDGWEGRLWELLMGEQIHIGGFAQSKVMAEQAGFKAGDRVLDLCSGIGGGLRFLVKNYKVKGYGLEAVDHMITEARKRTELEGLADQIEYRQGDVIQIPWDDDTFDGIWGEDAWCYVDARETLIKEAARVLKPGGVIAFSDWMTGPQGLSDEENQRIHNFMTFPHTETLESYSQLLKQAGFTIKVADELCDHFAMCVDIYVKMLTEQHTYDALKILGDNQALYEKICQEMAYMRDMAQQGKFGRGRIVAIYE